jgi:hypothetical protein
MNTAKRSAASRKAWRTRKRMKAARQANSSWLEKTLERLGVEHDDSTPPDAWPEYKRRALPLPDFGKVQ